MMHTTDSRPPNCRPSPPCFLISSRGMLRFRFFFFLPNKLKGPEPRLTTLEARGGTCRPGPGSGRARSAGFLRVMILTMFLFMRICDRFSGSRISEGGAGRSGAGGFPCPPCGWQSASHKGHSHCSLSLSSQSTLWRSTPRQLMWYQSLQRSQWTMTPLTSYQVCCFCLQKHQTSCGFGSSGLEMKVLLRRLPTESFWIFLRPEMLHLSKAWSTLLSKLSVFLRFLFRGDTPIPFLRRKARAARGSKPWISLAEPMPADTAAASSVACSAPQPPPSPGPAVIPTVVVEMRCCRYSSRLQWDMGL
mmetsp:Transcript_5383/g.9885  ORF Transcript_5383/g.9885 Transcript_5383/m.9885 type:complete len:304 (+) Transcript_5383:1575-2486(+)